MGYASEGLMQRQETRLTVKAIAEPSNSERAGQGKYDGGVEAMVGVMESEL